jgi:hypothetical protein
MNRADLMNGGAFARTAFQAINKTATAGSTGDATEVDCAWVDRFGDADGPVLSAKLVITYTAALAAQGNTLSFGVQMQDATSIGGAGGDDYGTAVASTVAATGNSGGSTETGTFEVDIDLAAARQFVRAQITPNLSAADTDTCEWSAALVLFGSAAQPMTLAVGSVGGAADTAI